MQGVWPSPKMLPTGMVHGQAFHIINLTTPPSRGHPLFATWGCNKQLSGFELWEHSPEPC
jgi:hypothetical protein